MKWTAGRLSLLALAAFSAALAGTGGAEAQRGGYASSGIGRGGFGGGRFAISRGGSYGSSRQALGGIGFGPGYGPGAGGLGARSRPGRYGYGYGAGYGRGLGVSRGFGQGRIGRAGIAPSPVLPPALYSVGRTRGSAVQAGMSGPRASGPLLIVIGDRR